MVSRPIKTTFLRSWSRPCWSCKVLASLVLVSACLVLVSEGGLEQDLRLRATATLLVRKSKLASECAPLFTYLLAFPHLAVSNSYLIYTTTLRTYLETWSWSRDRSRPLFEVLVLVLVSTLLVLVLVFVSASLVLVSVSVSACLVLVWSWSRTPWS